MATSTMKGVFLPGSFKVELRDVPVPTPKHGQVLIQVFASSICGSDLRVIYRDRDPAQCEQPCDVVCGHEPAGRIASVGEECRSFKVGDRVALYHIVGCERCAACREGYMLMCEEANMPTADTVQYKAYGWQRDGGHATYMLAEEKSCIRLPDNLTYADGALIACGFGTAWEALKRVNPSGKHSMLVTGLGPVGMAVALLARQLGVATIYGTDVSEYRLAYANKSGAFSATFDVKKYDDAAVMAAISADRQQDTLINDLKGVDIAIDCSGSAPGRSLAIKSTRRWGHVVFVGEGGSVTFDVSPCVIHKQLTLHGSWVTSLPHMEELVQFCSLRNFHPDVIVTARFPLTKAEAAYQLADSGNCSKVLIEPQSEE